jgi:hypothetical protein
VKRDLAGKPGPAFSGSHSKTWNSKGAHRAEKGSPAKGTGHTLLVAAQYSEKLAENNALFAVGLADFRSSSGPLQGPWASSVG